MTWGETLLFWVAATVCVLAGVAWSADFTLRYDPSPSQGVVSHRPFGRCQPNGTTCSDLSQPQFMPCGSSPCVHTVTLTDPVPSPACFVVRAESSTSQSAFSNVVCASTATTVTSTTRPSSSTVRVSTTTTTTRKHGWGKGGKPK